MCIYFLYISYWEFSLERVKVKEQTTKRTIKNNKKLEIKNDAVFFIHSTGRQMVLLGHSRVKLLAERLHEERVERS